jgi:hypothetical protein
MERLMDCVLCRSKRNRKQGLPKTRKENVLPNKAMTSERKSIYHWNKKNEENKQRLLSSGSFACAQP